MSKTKIILQVLAKKPSFTIDPLAEYAFVGGGTAGGYGIISENKHFSSSMLLGLLNSSLLDFFHKKISTPFSGGYYAYSKQYLEKLPLFNNEDGKTVLEKCNSVVLLVDKIIKLEDEKATTKNPRDLKDIEREIAQTDREINNIIYDLYDLTDEEIAIVEDSLSN
jgi:hypothetical protein